MNPTVTEPALAPSLSENNGRFYRADNIRCIMLFNVILFHMVYMLEPVKTPAVMVMLTFFRFTSMPVFCFLSGYFSKNTEKASRNAIFDYLLPYLLFNWLYVTLVEKVPIYTVAIPEFLYWYLLSMFVWRLISPVLTRVRFILPLSIAAAVAVGFAGEIDTYLSLSRTIAFLPYFVAGLLLSRESLDRLSRLPKWLVVAVAAAVLGVCAWARAKGYYDLDSLLNYGPYWWHYNNDILRGALVRLLSYPVSFVFIIFFLNVVPNRKMAFLTRHGQNTLVPYIGHAYVATWFSGFFAARPELQTWYIVLPWAIFASVVCLLVLGLPWWENAYKFVQGWLKSIFVRSEEAL